MANVNQNSIIGLSVAAVIILVLFSIIPMIASMIDDSYTVTDTSDRGWDITRNDDLHSPAKYWTIFSGLLVLSFLISCIVMFIVCFKDMLP